MTVLTLRTLCFALTVTLALSDLQADQPIKEWTLKELQNESDLIVVVRPVSWRIPDDPKMVVPISWNHESLLAIITTFDVETIFKGDHQGRTLELCHYKHRSFYPHLGPNIGLATFTDNLDDKVQMADQYLLYLKRDQLGRLTFVSGQDDPRRSIRILKRM